VCYSVLQCVAAVPFGRSSVSFDPRAHACTLQQRGGNVLENRQKLNISLWEFIYEFQLTFSFCKKKI